jgi:acrylyl-CoA reductase (NADPH)
LARALQVAKSDTEGVSVVLRDDLTDAELGLGDVTVDVDWSGINDKDGLALAGNSGVMRVSP